MVKSPIQIKNLSKRYSHSSGVTVKKKKETLVLKNVSLTINRGEVFALVGESGCGKTTLGKCILRFIPANAGEIIFDHVDLLRLSEKEFKPYRKKIQMIFQNPQLALNPKQTIGSCILEILKTHENNSNDKNRERLLELLNFVHLDEKSVMKYPFELSGGQQQRLGIARALATGPDFIVADEPTSSLDAIIKQQIIDLFKELQKNLGLTILFISHDLAIVSKIADRIGVMYKGELVEQAPKEILYDSPSHPYTQLLLESADIAGFGKNSCKHQQIINEEIQGCNFAERCPEKQQICYSNTPEFEEIDSGHQVMCHFAIKKVIKESLELIHLMDV